MRLTISTAIIEAIDEILKLNDYHEIKYLEAPRIQV